MSGLVEDRLSMLEAKIARLEARNKLLRWVFLLCLICGLTLAFLNRTGAEGERWRGKEIAILDQRGKVRVSLDIRSDSPGLALFDQKGGIRLSASVGPDGTPGIWLYDEDGQGRAAFEMFGDSSHLHFNTRRGKELVSLGLNHDETTYLHLFSQERKEYWKAP